MTTQDDAYSVSGVGSYALGPVFAVEVRRETCGAAEADWGQRVGAAAVHPYCLGAQKLWQGDHAAHPLEALGKAALADESPADSAIGVARQDIDC